MCMVMGIWVGRMRGVRWVIGRKGVLIGEEEREMSRRRGNRRRL